MSESHQQVPILPHAPWYQSDVQRYLVLSIALQLAAIAVGAWKTGGLLAFVAGALQASALLTAAVASHKRQCSPVSPLTLTRRGAIKLQKHDPAIVQGDFTV